jgi:hypothetical protein
MSTTTMQIHRTTYGGVAVTAALGQLLIGGFSIPHAVKSIWKAPQ